MPNKEQRDLIFQKLRYCPTVGQQAIHDCETRVRLVAGGERSGKSYSSALDMVSRLFEGKLFWLCAQDYERTKAEFNYIDEALWSLKVPHTRTKDVDPGEIFLPELGITILTKSAKDPRRLAMQAPDGILVCEASQIDYETFLRLRGRLAEKRGWMLLSGTFESSLGWYVEMYQLGQARGGAGELTSFSLPTWSNYFVFPGGREDPEIKALEASASTEWFLERFGGEPVPPRGLVFPEFRNHIHVGNETEFEFDPTYPVHIWVDPGFHSFYAVLAAQKRGEDIYIFDEVYETGLVTSEMITVIKQMHWAGSIVGGAIDIAGLQHQAMPAPAEIWSREGNIYLRSQKIRLLDGIERLKSMLKVNPLTQRPRVFINSKCEGLISEFGGCLQPKTGRTAPYRWKTDNQGRLTGPLPEDRNNHAIKAAIYGIVDMLGYSIAQRQTRIKFF